MQTPSGFTFNGIALEECAGAEVTNDATAVGRGVMGCSIWGLGDPLTGSPANLVETMDGGQPTRMMSGYGSWSDVNLDTPFGTPETSTDEGTSASFQVDPATTDNDVAIAVMVSSTNAATDVTPAGTQIFEVDEQSSFGTNGNAQYAAHDGSSPTTLTWAKGATRQAAGVGVALQGTEEGGTEEIAGTAAQVFANSGTLTGTGALAGAAAQAFSNAGVMVGDGALAGAAGLVFSNVGVLLGDGALVGAADLAFALDGALNVPDGAIEGSATLAFSNAGALTGTAELDGDAAMAFSGAATLQGTAGAAGAAGMVFSNAGAMRGTGALAGSAAVAFDADGVLTVSGGISGSAAITFAPSGTLTGTGALAGEAGITWSASAVATQDLRGRIAVSESDGNSSSSDTAASGSSSGNVAVTRITLGDS